jgi:hypothetical protein
MESFMPLVFDDEVYWDAEVLTGWASQGQERIRCRAGRETINELPGLTHATSPEIAKGKAGIFETLKPSFVRKIEAGVLDAGQVKSVTLMMSDLGR